MEATSPKDGGGSIKEVLRQEGKGEVRYALWEFHRVEGSVSVSADKLLLLVGVGWSWWCFCWHSFILFVVVVVFFLSFFFSRSVGIYCCC